jgi:protein-L-isoaspartate O-methyltransferase
MATAQTPIDPDAFNRFEAAAWEQRPDGYHRFIAPITTRVIEQLLDDAEVDRGARVLDVATGPGYVAAACARRQARADRRRAHPCARAQRQAGSRSA